MGVKWKNSKAIAIYEECLKQKRYPIVIRATFDSVYVYCKETGKIWRITGEVKETTLEEWKKGGGKDPIPEE